MASPPMITPKLATQAGLLPIIDKPVRFAVGAPDGITSNSWKSGQPSLGSTSRAATISKRRK